MLAPLIKSSLSINNIVADSLIKTNPDSSISLVYETNLYKLTLDTLLSLPAVGISHVVKLDSIVMPPITIVKAITLEDIANSLDAFTKALEMSKDSIPESSLINGQNPLLLLHRALSDGIHTRTDQECLELASSVRVVLTELSEKLSIALKDEAGLTKALSTLMNIKKDK